MTISREIQIQHVYRNLLRAASYLPDSIARIYIHNNIVSRFRSAVTKTKTSNISLASINLTRKRINDAQHYAQILQRACDGSLPDLKQVLLHTYGRTGKRKRELINDLLAPEEQTLPLDDAALETLIKNPTGGKSLRFLEDSKFYAFLRSQSQNNPAEAKSTDKIRNLKAKIPEENAWGRPTPKKAQAGLRSRWWAQTLDKLYPPIPQHEWNRLRDLATGKIPLEDPPYRRSKVGDKVGDPKMKEMELIDHFRTPTKDAGIKDLIFDKDQGLMISNEGHSCDPAYGGNLPVAKRTRDYGCFVNHMYEERPIDKRSMRRLYATIWNLTPTMIKNEYNQQWDTIWGGARSAAHSGEVTKPSLRDEELFVGIEELPKPKGKVKGSQMPYVDGRNKDDRGSERIFV